MKKPQPAGQDLGSGWTAKLFNVLGVCLRRRGWGGSITTSSTVMG